MRPAIQLYGQFDSYWSNANVSRGIALGLLENGVSVRCWDRLGEYRGLPKHPQLSFGMPTGTDVVGAFVGYPHMSTEALRDHGVKVGFFIAESSVIPQQWAYAASACDLVVVPSAWTRTAYERAGVRNVLIAHHGLHPVFSEQPRQFWTPTPMRFLHIAGARDFIDRKGTPQLVEAFVKVAKAHPELLKLHIRTPPSPQLVELQHKHDPRGEYIEVDYHDAPLSPGEMHAYLMQPPGWTALVQPSRAEAFGIIPLEGRACGIPAILSEGHGHLDHIAREVDTLIACGLEKSIRVNGIPNGAAPTVTVEAIEKALLRFLAAPAERIKAAQLVADRYYLRHTWQQAMKPIAEWLKKQYRGRGRTILEKM